MYDVIVVGARCAGSPTAMLLARSGHSVLLIDKATFPSDTVSTHFLWPRGAEQLARWGLLDRLATTGLTPMCTPMSMDFGPFALRGPVPDANDGRGGFCPRRTVLDRLLVEAAEKAGVEVRQGFAVEGLLFDNGRVVGVRGRAEGGRAVEERARLVVGADGIHSVVARAIRAQEYDTHPVLECAYYSYFSGVEQDDLELFLRENTAFGGAPTHDGLHIVTVNWPAARFGEIKSDIDGHFMAALDLAPEYGARVRAAKREDKWHGTAGVPNYFRASHGDGWALVGDAGYNRDPITAQGITDAFLDADDLARAIDDGFTGRRALREALAEHEVARNARVRPMYEFTCHLATLAPPPPEMQRLFTALHGNQTATNAFFSAITGATPLEEFLAPQNVERIVAATKA